MEHNEHDYGAVASCEVPAGDLVVGGSVAAASCSSSVRPPVLHAFAVRGAGNRRQLAFALVAGVLVLVAVVLIGRLMTDAAMATDFAAKNLAPTLAHPFGTDWMGRDMLARTLAGLSTSLFVGLLAAVASSLIALVLAAVAALGGPCADAAVSWLIDLVMGIPHIVLLILISYALGKGFWGVTVGLALTHWPSLARVLRAEILQLRSAPFMAVSRSLGVSPARLALTHALPAIVPQLIVGAVLTFPHAILHEASLTFLGFGLPPDQPAVGTILSEAMGYLSTGSWWLAIFPGAALVACVLLFERLGILARRLVDARTAQE